MVDLCAQWRDITNTGSQNSVISTRRKYEKKTFRHDQGWPVWVVMGVTKAHVSSLMNDGNAKLTDARFYLTDAGRGRQVAGAG